MTASPLLHHEVTILQAFADETTSFRSWIVRDGEDELTVTASREPDQETFYTEPWPAPSPVPANIVVK